MKYFKLIQRLSANQMWWICSAYWRLLNAQLRIKLKQQSWLQKKLSDSGSKFARSNRFESSTAMPEVEGDALYSTQNVQVSAMNTQALALHESVRLAAKLQFWSTQCLPRSIVLVDMLKQQGFAAVLKLGINKDQGRLSSHAWVEIDGEMIGEPDSVSNAFVSFNGNH